MGRKAYNHPDLEVYRLAFDTAMRIFDLSKSFPKEERYSLTDQIRKSSRSVCAQIAEAWRRRRYRAVFINKISESEREAAETQSWLQFAVSCGYVQANDARTLYANYNKILGILVGMITHADSWTLPPIKKDQDRP